MSHLLSTFRSFQPDQRHGNSPRHTSEQVNKSMGISLKPTEFNQ